MPNIGVTELVVLCGVCFGVIAIGGVCLGLVVFAIGRGRSDKSRRP